MEENTWYDQEALDEHNKRYKDDVKVGFVIGFVTTAALLITVVGLRTLRKAYKNSKNETKTEN